MIAGNDSPVSRRSSYTQRPVGSAQGHWRALLQSVALRVALPVVCLAVAPALGWGQVRNFHSPEEALLLAFPNGEQVRPVGLSLPEAQRALIAEKAQAEVNLDVTKCFQGSSQGRIVGYACIDNMLGRERYITYIVRIDHPAAEISLIEVMQYREAVGALVGYPRYTRQFVGKTIRDWIWIGKDIRRIIGATLSAVALASGSRKILHLYHEYLKNLPGE